MTGDGSTTTSVLLVGVGGQGILLASEIIARAAMIAGFAVKTNEVHGMAQRGGSVLAQIRYGKEVYSPLISEGTARVLGSLERIEGIRFAHYLAAEGLAVVSSQAIIPVTVSSGAATYPIDAEERVRKTFSRLLYVDAATIASRIGNIRASNVVILGALSTGLDLPIETWHESIRECVPDKHRELNLRAFEEGRQQA